MNSYYHTDWLTEDNLPVKMEGLSIDAVYENFVRQIAGEQLKEPNNAESLKDSVEKGMQKQALEKKIVSLKIKLKKEKQFNRQVELNSEIKKLNKELGEL